MTQLQLRLGGPEWLASVVAPRLDAFDFTFPRLAEEPEDASPGARVLGWAVLDRLAPEFERIGWAAIRTEVGR